MKQPAFRLIFLMTLLLVGCSKDDDKPTEENNQTAESPFDISETSAVFLADETYGNKARNKMDVWYLPNSQALTGVVIYVHGGGFRSGDKSFVHLNRPNLSKDFPTDITNLLSNNIAFVAINYTLIDSENEEVGIEKSLADIKYAVQYLRNKADQYNIDKSKIVMAGNSAGASASLLLSVIPDRAKPNSPDPVLRESTRVSGTVLFNTQATLDLTRWGATVFQEYELNWFSILNSDVFKNTALNFYGIDSISQLETPELEDKLAQVEMLRLISDDDPEIFAETIREKIFPVEREDFNHHVNHVAALKTRCEDVGSPITAYYGENPVIYADPSGETWTEFILRKMAE